MQLNIGLFEGIKYLTLTDVKRKIDSVWLLLFRSVCFYTPSSLPPVMSCGVTCPHHVLLLRPLYEWKRNQKVQDWCYRLSYKWKGCKQNSRICRRLSQISSTAFTHRFDLCICFSVSHSSVRRYHQYVYELICHSVDLSLEGYLSCEHGTALQDWLLASTTGTT